ncbi:phage head closure protein [Hwanghaeella sp.]|uniref:phage head closure protein n=1 Tax=Hwanghaeella sp. TaxID=2605943 RepID=UPI003CCBF980
MAPRVEDPGQLREPVEIRKWQQFPDIGDDDLDNEYPLVAKVRAKFEAVGGVTYREGVQAGEIVTHRATIRYRDDVTSENVIIRRRKRYQVRRAAELDDKLIWLVIDLEEIGPHE